MSIITAKITSRGTMYTFDETQIIINPTISKSICSGGYSAGNTACACLKIGVPYNFYNKGDLVKVFYGSNQIMGNFYIDSFEKCGYAKINPTDTYLTQMVMLTCYDSMSKLDDYYSFSTETVTSADICSKITELTGLNFATNSAIGMSFEMPKADAESKTMREWLGVFGAYLGGNYIIHPYWLNNAYVEEITLIPIDYSGAGFTAIENTKITVENDITFSKVICRASETYKSGDDTGETLSIDCQYASQDSTDIIQSNIKGEYYTAFKCDKAIIDFVSVDIGDTFIPKNATAGYKMYNLDLVISIKGLYLTCGADVFKKKINDEPQIKKSDELKAITEFAVTVSNGIATFTWKNPTSNFTGVILKRKATTDFNNIFEGETIYTGNAETYADTLPNDYTTYYYRILSYYGDNYNADCDGLSVSATSTKTVKEVTDFQYATSGYIWNYLNGGSTLQCLVGINGYTNQIGLLDYQYPYTNNTRQLIISNPIRSLIGGATTGWTMKIKIHVNATLYSFVDYDKIGIGNTANSNGIFNIETVLADGKQGGILAAQGDKTIEYQITSELNINDRLIFQLNSASQAVGIYKIWFEKENT